MVNTNDLAGLIKTLLRPPMDFGGVASTKTWPSASGSRAFQRPMLSWEGRLALVDLKSQLSSGGESDCSQEPSFMIALSLPRCSKEV